MTRRRSSPILSTALGGALLLGFSAGPAPAAPDPDLLILQARVNAVGSLLNAFGTKVAVVDTQFELLFAEREQGLVELGDKRVRDLEAILMTCATSPEKCMSPLFLASVLTPECNQPEPPPPPGNPPDHDEHDVGLSCPVAEVIDIVIADRDAAEAAALARDYPEADRRIEEAQTALDAGDAVSAFLAACKAFKVLACP